MEFHEVLAKIKQANYGQTGEHFFLLDGYDVDFAYSALVDYPPTSLVTYQGSFYLRNTRLDGYGPGILPTNITFFTTAIVNPSVLDNKLTVEFVEAYPDEPQEEVLYVDYVAEEAKVFKAGKLIALGAPPPVESEPYIISLPVPIIVGFNSNLDTASRVRLYFAQSIAGITWDIDPNKVTTTRFSAFVSDESLAVTHTSTSELQAWVDDFGTTGFYVDIIITPASGAENQQLTGVFTHYKTYSVPTITTISGGTGYASYRDTQYTQAVPFRLIGDQEMILPNNAAIVIDDQLPADVSAFYDSATQKITPALSGDGYTFRISMKAIPTVANAEINLSIDIGGDFGKILPTPYTVAVGAGNLREVSIPIAGAFSGDTFTANGGQIKITASHDIDVWDMNYTITRTHKAR